MKIQTIKTTPFFDQKPGTSGLRKKVKVFQQENYLENFIQSVFETFSDLSGTLILGGDGRFFSDHAREVILKMAAANGVGQIIMGENGLLSTPAVSYLIKKYKTFGAISLTASHNPAGKDGDFGVKINLANGGAAPETFSNLVLKKTQTITEYKIADQIPSSLMKTIDPVKDYADLIEMIFDFDLIKKFIQETNFSFCFDAMHAVTGPYATEIFIHRLGLKKESVINAKPLPDFGGVHADPNLVHAKELLKIMFDKNAPDFGAACDGDGDRNMILGKNFFINPCDSLAIITANAHLIPAYKNGLQGVAKNIATTSALDRVAERLGIPCFIVPVGWKYFVNLLEADKITICGEESFGTGANHIREKDGLWAILAWMNILAVTRKSIQEITEEHWKEYGRYYFTRHDYENLDSEQAQKILDHLLKEELKGKEFSSFGIKSVEDFEYIDPVDGSVSSHQGIQVCFTNGSRITYRLSGTGSVGATLRIYMEYFEPNPAKHHEETQTYLKELIDIAADIAQIETYTARTKPDVIT